MPYRKNLTIRRGDRFREHVAFITPNGRIIEDLVTTSGSTAVTSESGFLTTDTGKTITVVDGSGVTDGTTLTVTGTTTGTLSAAATASRDGVLATVGAADLSGYTGHVAQFREVIDAADTLADFTVTTSRASVGIVTFSLTDSETLGLDAGGVWDWQAEGPHGNVTLLYGVVKLVKDVSQ